MTICLLTLVSHTTAVQPQPALLTVGSVIPRFDESPLTSEQWLAEIGQLDTATGQHTVLVPLWGANAPLYAAQVSGLSWSPRSQLLALSLLNSQGQAGLFLYDAETESYRSVIAFEDGYTEISKASWLPDATQLVVSVKKGEATPQILGFNLLRSSTMVLMDGWLPVYTPSGEAMIYLNSSNEAILHTLADGQERTLVLFSEEIRQWEWLPDQDSLILNTGTAILRYDVASERPTLIYEIRASQYAEDTIMDMALSPDGTQIALTRLAQNADGTGLSQIITIELAAQQLTIQAERVFGETLPDDVRIFLKVDYQPPGAFLPGASAEGDF